MADTKISALTAVVTPAGADEFAVNQSGTSKKETLTQIDAFVAGASGSSANKALSNLAGVGINTTLLSDTDNTDDLGTSTVGWKDLYLSDANASAPTTNGQINYNSANTRFEFYENGAVNFLGNVAVTYNNIGDATGASTIAFAGNANTWQIGADIASGDFFTIEGGAAGEFTASSGSQNFIQLSPHINQSSTAGYTAIDLDVTETSTGSGTSYFLDLKVGSVQKFNIDVDGNMNSTGTMLYIDSASSAICRLDRVSSAGGTARLDLNSNGVGRWSIGLDDDGTEDLHFGLTSFGFKVLSMKQVTGVTTWNMTGDLGTGDFFTFGTTATAELTGIGVDQNFVRIYPEIGQSSSSGYSVLEIDVDETSIGTGENNLLRIANSGTTLTRIDRLGQHLESTQAGITASTTQSQGQQPLTKDLNEISTVANANDVVTIPIAEAGKQCRVINSGANTLQIFPASGDDLGAGVNTSTTLAAGGVIKFVAYDGTNWISF